MKKTKIKNEKKKEKHTKRVEVNCDDCREPLLMCGDGDEVIAACAPN